MKQCITIIVVGLLVYLMGNISRAEIFEKRVIVPYPTDPENTTVPTTLIKKMPYIQPPPDIGSTHVMPYFHVVPNPYSQGLGTGFGINFDIFRSYGLNFDINLF